MKTLRYTKESLAEVLQRSLQPNSPTPLPEAPPWVHELASAFNSDLGLLALHGKSGLAEQLPEFSTLRVELCAVDDLLLLIAQNAIAARRHTGLAIPPGTVMLPLLMVCKALLGDLLEQHEALGASQSAEGIKQRGGILLVSPDTELRARYFSMRVGAESVVDSYPACRMRPNGTITSVVHTQNDTSSPPFSVCFFLARMRQLPDPAHVEFRPAVVLLDLMHDKWVDRLDSIIDWCLSLRDARGEPTTLLVLHPYGDRTSRDALERHTFLDFPLTYDGVEDLIHTFSPISPPSDHRARSLYSAWSFGAYAHDKPLERERKILCVPDEAAHDVMDVVSNLYAALDSVGDNLQSHRDLRLARWLMGTLMQLPVPVEWYEQHAYLMGNRQTLKKLISSIGAETTWTLYPELVPVLQSVRGHLELLYNRLTLANPKSQTFRQYCTTVLLPMLTAGRQVVYLARNDVIARALWPWLLSAGFDLQWQPNLRVLTYKQVDGRTLFDAVVATGPWPARYRWQIGGRLGQSVDFLLYQDEVSILEQQVAVFYGARTQWYCERTRFGVLREFGDIQTPPPEKELPPRSADDRVPVEDSRFQSRPDMQGNTEIEDDTDITSIFSTIDLDPGTLAPTVPTMAPLKPPERRARIARRYDDEGEEPVDGVGMDEGGPAEGPTEDCVMVRVQLVGEHTHATDQQYLYLYLSADGTTECYVPTRPEDGVVSIAADEIEPGVILVRTDEEDRQSLFDRIVQVADTQPTMKYLATWRAYWLDAIDDLVQKHASDRAKRSTYRELRQQLATAGVYVTEATVRDWVLGVRIGPATLESIRAVGTIAEHPMLLQYADRVDAAFNQIRAIHRVLGRRISSALQHLGKVVHGGTAGVSTKVPAREVYLDPALAVPIDDLLDLLEFYEVSSIDPGPWLVPYSHVGVLMHRPLYGGS